MTIITSAYKPESFEDFWRDTVDQTIFDLCEWKIAEVEEQTIVLPEDRPNVSYEFIPERLTVYQTWNSLIEKSRTPYIANYNCDDRSHPQHLEKLVGYLQTHSDISVAYCPNIETRVAGENFFSTKSRVGFPCLAFNPENYHNNNSCHSRPMWKRELHDSVGYFNEDYFSAADFDFWLRCIRSGVKFGKVGAEALYLYYRNPEGISSSSEGIPRAIEEINKILKIHATQN